MIKPPQGAVVVRWVKMDAQLKQQGTVTHYKPFTGQQSAISSYLTG